MKKDNARLIVNLARRLVSVREEEATRISRKVHDELGQPMLALNIDLDWLENQMAGKNAIPRAKLLKRIRAMSVLVKQTVLAVGSIASELRPSVLDDFGLEAAIEWQVEEFQNRNGICCTWKHQVENLPLDGKKAETVFRIFKETLANVARHSGAHHVEVSLDMDASHFILTVQDDGQGFAVGKTVHPKSLGLMGMRERALLAGGSIEFGKGSLGGAEMRLRVPVEANPQ